MINNDFFIDNEIHFKENKDERLLDKNIAFNLNGAEFNLEVFQKAFPNYRKKYKALIYWDDMMQYTAVGLVDVISEKKNLNFFFDIDKFVNRKEYPNGIDYVKNVIYPDMDPKEIDAIYRNNYFEILQRSPITPLFNNIFYMKNIVDSYTLTFPFKFPELDEFVASYKTDPNIPLQNVNYAIINDEDRAKELLVKLKPNLIICPDMGLFFYEITLRNIKNTVLISYEKHNGVTEFILDLYFNFVTEDGEKLYKPYNTELILLKEKYYPELTKEEMEKEDENKFNEYSRLYKDFSNS